MPYLKALFSLEEKQSVQEKEVRTTSEKPSYTNQEATIEGK